MATGLRVWDASGNLIVDTSNRLTRILGYTTFSGTSSISVTDDGFLTGQGFFVVQRSNAPSGVVDTSTAALSISFASNQMFVSGGTAGADYIIMYGVY